MRADVLLVARGLAPSRTAAQRLIAAGHVFALDGIAKVALTKPSVNVHDDVQLEIEVSELDRFVSRGGLKLEGALNRVALDIKGYRCLDVGQSTGGFTDCLLQHGAAHVVGVDVGHDQLHAKFRNHSRVTCIEGTNARVLTPVLVGAACRDPALHEKEQFREEIISEVAVSRSYKLAEARFDLIVADVSFISLTKVLPQWPALLRKDGHVLCLVKPQFEVGADNLARGGIVRDESLYLTVEKTIRKACSVAGLNVLDYFDSSITGGDGNREFFVHTKLTERA